tara:strand:+ start:824 stop:1063 length:240 start_codon:yes stop_codon:yes gene_type:complete
MFITYGQDVEATGGYVPSLVTENEPGHQMMMGNGECAAPWIWGQTHEEAQAIADAYNAKNGISKSDADAIVTSSMFPKS